MATAIMAHYHRGLSRAKGGEGEDIAFRVLESSLMGLALGFIEAQSKTGLDIGIGKTKAPIDLALGGLGLAGSLFLPMDKDQRAIVERMSAVAWGIGVQRKSSAFFKSKITTHGEEDLDSSAFDMGEDPVVEAAKML
jgi:hypothetical protein